MHRAIKVIVEHHSDGYVAYPLGLKGVVVGEGDAYAEALRDLVSAIQFHIESFGEDVLALDGNRLSLRPLWPKLRLNWDDFLRDGTQTPLTMPSHRRIKGSTLRTILTQARIPRQDFLDALKDV